MLSFFSWKKPNLIEPSLQKCLKENYNKNITNLIEKKKYKVFCYDVINNTNYDIDKDSNLDKDFNLDKDLDKDLNLDKDLDKDLNLDKGFNLNKDLGLDKVLNLDKDLGLDKVLNLDKDNIITLFMLASFTSICFLIFKKYK